MLTLIMLRPAEAVKQLGPVVPDRPSARCLSACLAGYFVQINTTPQLPFIGWNSGGAPTPRG
jgi:hypothetical protein